MATQLTQPTPEAQSKPERMRSAGDRLVIAVDRLHDEVYALSGEGHGRAPEAEELETQWSVESALNAGAEQQEAQADRIHFLVDKMREILY